MEDRKLTIAIVDDHSMFRQSLAHLLAESGEIRVLFDVGNGVEMIAKLDPLQLPDVVLMDINMPEMNGYESIRWLKQHHKGVHVLVLSMFEEEKPIIDSLRCGAGGYVLKQARVSELLLAIGSMAKNGFYINDLVSGTLLHSLHRELPAEKPLLELSKNELRFLKLACSELTYKEIASHMNLSPFTINNYRETLFEKFQVKSRTGLVIYGLKCGLISLEGG